MNYVTTVSGKCYHISSCHVVQNKATKQLGARKLKPCKKCCPALIKKSDKTLIMDTEGVGFPTQIAAIDLDSGEFHYSANPRHTRLTPGNADWIVAQRAAILALANDAKTVTVYFHNMAGDRKLLNESHAECANGEPFFPKHWVLVDSVPVFRAALKLKSFVLNKCVRAALKAYTGEPVLDIIARVVLEENLRTAMEASGKLHNALVDAGLLRASLLAVLA